MQQTLRKLDSIRTQKELLDFLAKDSEIADTEGKGVLENLAESTLKAGMDMFGADADETGPQSSDVQEDKGSTDRESKSKQADLSSTEKASPSTLDQLSRRLSTHLFASSAKPEDLADLGGKANADDGVGGDQSDDARSDKSAGNDGSEFDPMDEGHILRRFEQTGAQFLEGTGRGRQ